MANNKKSNLSNTDVKAIVLSVVLLIVGILFCCTSVLTTAMSIIIGIGILVLGLGLLASSFIETKKLVSGGAIAGGAIIAFGIMFMIDKLAGIIFAYIPYFLIALGALFLLDAIILIATTKKASTRFYIELVIGVIALVLGILLICVNGFADYASIVFGVILILYAVYLCVTVFVKKR